MVKERSEPRMLCAELVNVRWKDDAGHGHRSSAILEDISASGACVQLEEAIPINTELEILVSRGMLTGSVVYCVYRDIGYFAGVRLHPDSKWSRRDYQPDHLLDLQKLLSRAIRTAARRAQRGEIVQ